MWGVDAGALESVAGVESNVECLESGECLAGIFDVVLEWIADVSRHGG